MRTRRRRLLGSRVDLAHLLQPLRALLLGHLRELLGLLRFGVAFDLLTQCRELGRELRGVRIEVLHLLEQFLGLALFADPGAGDLLARVPLAYWPQDLL